MVDCVNYRIFRRLQSLEDEFSDSAGSTAKIDNFALLADLCDIEQSSVHFGVER